MGFCCDFIAVLSILLRRGSKGWDRSHRNSLAQWSVRLVLLTPVRSICADAARAWLKAIHEGLSKVCRWVLKARWRNLKCCPAESPQNYLGEDVCLNRWHWMRFCRYWSCLSMLISNGIVLLFASCLSCPLHPSRIHPVWVCSHGLQIIFALVRICNSVNEHFFAWIAGCKIHPGFVPFISIFSRLQFFFLGSVKLRMRLGVFNFELWGFFGNVYVCFVNKDSAFVFPLFTSFKCACLWWKKGLFLDLVQIRTRPWLWGWIRVFFADFMASLAWFHAILKDVIVDYQLFYWREALWPGWSHIILGDIFFWVLL